MSYEELAQRVVALGVGMKVLKRHYLVPGLRSMYSTEDQYTAEEFISDGRVSQAMMGLCDQVQFVRTTTGGSWVVARKGNKHGYAEQPKGNDAIAILTACADVLEGT